MAWGGIDDRSQSRDDADAILHVTHTLENAAHHPHDPARHVVDPDQQTDSQRNSPHCDRFEGLQRQPSRAHDQHSIERYDRHAHANDYTAGIFGTPHFFG